MTVLPSVVLFSLTVYFAFLGVISDSASRHSDLLQWLGGGALVCLAVGTAAIVGGVLRLVGKGQHWFVRWLMPILVIPLVPVGTVAGITALVWGGPDLSWPGTRSSARVLREGLWVLAGLVVAASWALAGSAMLPSRENLVEHPVTILAGIVLCTAVGAFVVWHGMKTEERRSQVDRLARGEGEVAL